MRIGLIGCGWIAETHLASLSALGEQVTHEIATGRRAWLQVVRGMVQVNGHDLDAGTGVAVEDEPKLTMAAQANGAELLLFDLP